MLPDVKKKLIRHRTLHILPHGSMSVASASRVSVARVVTELKSMLLDHIWSKSILNSVLGFAAVYLNVLHGVNKAQHSCHNIPYMYSSAPWPCEQGISVESARCARHRNQISIVSPQLVKIDPHFSARICKSEYLNVLPDVKKKLIRHRALHAIARGFFVVSVRSARRYMY